jgi:hypothetical protein
MLENTKGQSKLDNPEKLASNSCCQCMLDSPICIQYQQNKRKFKQRGSSIPPISTKQTSNFILVELTEHKKRSGYMKLEIK